MGAPVWAALAGAERRGLSSVRGGGRAPRASDAGVAGGRGVGSAGGRGGALHTGRRSARSSRVSFPPRWGRDRGSALASHPDAGAVRRCGRERRARSPARRRGRHDGDLRGDRPLSCRPRRAMGGRERDRCRGAFRDQPDPRPVAGTRPRLGRRRRPTCPAGMPERRASRPRPDLLWDRPSRSRLAHHLPGRRHPAIDSDRRRSPTRTEPDRAGGDQVVSAASARPRGANRDAADRHRRQRRTRRLADDFGATLLDVDPVTAATRVAADRG